MSKRGETRPHRVRYRWENGIKGCETFSTAGEADDFEAKLRRTAETRGGEVVVTREVRP